MQRLSFSLFYLAIMFATACAITDDATDDTPEIAGVDSVINIGKAWTGVSVGFAFITKGDKQYIAYYSSDRYLTVGQRAIGAPSFQLKTFADLKATPLTRFGGWDAHNYITMTVDSAGQLHLAANMHVSPLLYMRTTTAGDITTLKVEPMTGIPDIETSTTYPQFMTIEAGPQAGKLLFAYRSGGSGNGDWYWNLYDTATHKWTPWAHLFGGGAAGSTNKPTPCQSSSATSLSSSDEQAITDADAQPASASAYPIGPLLGPDGKYHIVWVWRAQADASTNYNLSYANSADLKNWEAIDGTKLTLPITPAQTAAVVQKISPCSGLVNGPTHVGWDANGRVMVSYLKYDATKQKNTQAYTARWENNAWKNHQTSDWSWHWEFSGVGAMATKVNISAIALNSGKLTQAFSNELDPDASTNHGTWTLDPTTLKPISMAATQEQPEVQAQSQPPIPPKLKQIQTPQGNLPASIYKEMTVHFLFSGDFLLRWEALAPTNFDKPRECKNSKGEQVVCAMPPSEIALYQLTK